MKILGISKVVSNDKVEGLLELWQKFSSENIAEKISNKVSEDIVAVYARYQGNYAKPYTLIIGCEVTNQPENSDMDFLEIDNSRHTLYMVKGEMPAVVMNKWMEIWNSNKPRAYIADYDIYKADGSVEIGVEYLS